MNGMNGMMSCFVEISIKLATMLQVVLACSCVPQNERRPCTCSGKQFVLPLLLLLLLQCTLLTYEAFHVQVHLALRVQEQDMGHQILMVYKGRLQLHLLLYRSCTAAAANAVRPLERDQLPRRGV
jgi:hypothetical protein